MSERAQLRVARGKEGKANRWKSFVRLFLGVFQKMGDNGRGDGVDQLRARVIAQQQTSELVIFDERNRVAVLAVLHRDADPISEELANIDRIPRHLNGRHQSFGGDQRAGWLELPCRQTIANHGVARDLKRSNSVEKIFLRRLEQGQVRFVIDHLHIGGGFFTRLRSL